ncbi:MAG: TIGR04211 family SH3 domain-containing protein [Gammaproteobacteria bacterium]|nr:TIGR04211 family SH3 domain-containing protein [Gammaproteobacteria bacterium]
MKTEKDYILFHTISRYFLSLLFSGLMFGHASIVSADEYVYISDHLRVGVRKEPKSGIPPISVVFTGMRLQVHEKTDGYLKITTDKGVTGWIKDIYVTKKAPAIIQLNALKEKYTRLEKDNAQGNNTAAVLEKANLALSEQLDELKAERREWTRERADLLATQYEESSWLWLVGLVFLVILSFVSGIFWYKNYVMKRLGGLRV